MAVSMTERAAERARQMLQKRGTPEAAIRIGVSTSGCSGLSYKLEYADQLQESDQQFASHGIRIVVDSKSLLALDGTEVDFEATAFKSGFKFNNPQMKEQCGCGESFKV
ncbi:HesB/IscA family protein [Candidatus Magnetaquicoccus inordinatus]|uniref:HesB/IscA family protein n=1 Tax=Candidatus Magnetaquicoccus inordinatus TaxID=2496818 RepID=UPI00102BFADA|nr:iron-sulfur cluster assembly accessory protein [Candidatus Magnetaquicoccus inordinatus]